LVVSEDNHGRTQDFLRSGHDFRKVKRGDDVVRKKTANRTPARIALPRGAGRLYPLLDELVIQQKVREMARQISGDYTHQAPLLVGILKGAWVFLADLVREITIPVTCDFLGVSSYGNSTVTSGVVKIVVDLKRPIAGEDVLLVEDIVDTGLTLKYLIDTLKLRKPRSVKVCALLDKPARHRVDMKIDYLGFTVPDKFLVGYGIDYAEHYRNLPYIGYLEFDNAKKTAR
jgi:hypoxanthine phosphoribosyltransferase